MVEDRARREPGRPDRNSTGRRGSTPRSSTPRSSAPGSSAPGSSDSRGSDSRGSDPRGRTPRSGDAPGKAPRRGDRRGDQRSDQRSDRRSDQSRGDQPRGDRSRGGGGRRVGTGRDVDQAVYDGPEIPEGITGAELDRQIAAQLRGLPEKLAARVARHLVAAGTLIDTDPETAYQHTLAARARAARVAVVREATGEAAYAAGHYAEALTELRAAKRMNGAPDYLPVIADCERALGRPERALEIATSPAVANLDQPQRIEMTIVEAGARHDLGETTSALRTLENAPLRSASREPWVVRLRYAYADLLAQTGRTHDAIEWFHRTAAIDSHHTTDATTRITELEQPNPDAASSTEPHPES